MERSPPNIDPPTRLALAVYYGECHSRGISQKRAAAAEEDVARQSKWWIRGDDPNHPAHNSVPDTTIKSNKDGEDSSSNIESAEAKEPENNGSAYYDDEDDQEESDSDWDAPIFAYDDDFTPASGGLQFSKRNARYNRNSSSITYPLVTASSKTPLTVSTGSTLLPIWLDRRSQGNSSKPILSEDVLRSYSTYPYTNLCCTSNKHPLSSSQSTNTAHPITSESEADDSFYRSEMSNDDSSSVVASRYIKPNKRLKLSEPFEASLDETFLQARIDHDIDEAKKDLLSRLDDGTSSKSFSKCLRRLEAAARRRKISPGDQGQDDSEGTWIMVSPPDYPSCLGTNVKGDKLYTLERMSFGMYQPADLLCSIQQQYNTITSVQRKADMPLYVPLTLKKEVDDESGKCSGRLKTYNIIVSFTLENQGHLRGIMTNYGYALPDPEHTRRQSIWFTGGTIEPADEDEESIEAWKRVFGANETEGKSEENSQCAEKAKLLAQKILLGAVSEPMDENGVIGFHLRNPIGGHSSAFCDVVYMDNDLRVMKGHSGSVYVFKRTGFD
ncbi:hypothetical protein ACHAWC_008218 [Mediolabrus comicus]